jgi:hypothetical protein
MDPTRPLPGETAKAFAAFCAYREMGPGRSIAKVGQALGKSTTLMARWSHTWSWVARARTWDVETAVRIAAAQQDELVEMAARHRKIAQAFLGKTVAGLVAFDPTTLSPAELRLWFVVATEAERTSRGLSGARSTPVVIAPPEPSPHPADRLSRPEQARRYRAMADDLEAEPVSEAEAAAEGHQA